MKILGNQQGKIYLSNDKVLLLYNKSKYGITIDDLLGDVDSNGVLQSPSEITGNLVFSGIKNTNSSSLLSYRFYKAKNFKCDVIFSDMETGVLQHTFDSSGVLSASFPKLKNISGRTLYQTFSYCENLTSILLPELESVSGSQCFYYCFSGLQIANISFPKLKTVNDTAFQDAFKNAGLLRDIYFNGLTTTSFGNTVGQFNNMFNGTTGASATGGCTVHFPSNLQSTISGLTGYPTFGGNSSYITLSFDLPATS